MLDSPGSDSIFVGSIVHIGAGPDRSGVWLVTDVVPDDAVYHNSTISAIGVTRTEDGEWQACGLYPGTHGIMEVVVGVGEDEARLTLDGVVRALGLNDDNLVQRRIIEERYDKPALEIIRSTEDPL